jgi:hypothetical protein
MIAAPWTITYGGHAAAGLGPGNMVSDAVPQHQPAAAGSGAQSTERLTLSHRVSAFLDANSLAVRWQHARLTRGQGDYLD